MYCVVGGFTLADYTTISGLLLGYLIRKEICDFVGGVRLQRVEGKSAVKTLSKAGVQIFCTDLGAALSSLPFRRMDSDRTKLVCELRYNLFTGCHFRHGTKSMRWRPDRAFADYVPVIKDAAMFNLLLTHKT